MNFWGARQTEELSAPNTSKHESDREDSLQSLEQMKDRQFSRLDKSKQRHNTVTLTELNNSER